MSDEFKFPLEFKINSKNPKFPYPQMIPVTIGGILNVKVDKPENVVIRFYNRETKGEREYELEIHNGKEIDFLDQKLLGYAFIIAFKLNAKPRLVKGVMQLNSSI